MIRFIDDLAAQMLLVCMAAVLAVAAGCQPRYEEKPAPPAGCECEKCDCENCLCGIEAKAKSAAELLAEKEVRHWPVPDPMDFSPAVTFHFHDDWRRDCRFYVTQETAEKLIELTRQKHLIVIEKYAADGRPYIEFKSATHIEQPQGLAETLREKGDKRPLSVSLRYSDWTSEEICVDRDKFEQVRKIIGATYSEPSSGDVARIIYNFDYPAVDSAPPSIAGEILRSIQAHKD